MKLIKGFLMSALLAAFATAANAAPTIEGNYYCKGYDPYSNLKYGGPVVIKKTSRDTYGFTWNLGENQFYSGTGLLDEDKNTLGVVFFNNQSISSAGVALYQILSDGSLRGQWTMNKDTKIGTENCVKQ